MIAKVVVRSPAKDGRLQYRFTTGSHAVPAACARAAIRDDRKGRGEKSGQGRSVAVSILHGFARSTGCLPMQRSGMIAKIKVLAVVMQA